MAIQVLKKPKSRQKRQNRFRSSLAKFLDGSGVTISEDDPNADIQVLNPEFYERVLSNPELELGESYMNGWWESPHLDQLSRKMFEARLHEKSRNLKIVLKNPSILRNLAGSFFSNPQSIKRSKEVAEQHYDLGHDLYEAMLGPTMSYTCPYWEGLEKTTENLDQAQINKMDLICRKLKLKPLEKVLELGCGNGSLAKFMAENYRVEVKALNISKGQLAYAEENNSHPNVEFIKADYRNAGEKFEENEFDKVVTVGLWEHIGPKNYADPFMSTIHHVTKPRGIVVAHTISKEKPGAANHWVNKRIFPKGHVPSDSQIEKSYKGKFQLLDKHLLINHYDPGLGAWYDNFQEAWPKLESKYGHQVNGKFKKMWDLYLLSTKGIFESRALRVTQIVLSNEEIENYQIER